MTVVVTTRARARIDTPRPFRIIEIGRGTALGNPFRAGKTHAGRIRAIQAYEARMHALLVGDIARPETLAALHALRDLVLDGENLALVCPGNCRPEKPCHGDVIKEYLDQYVNRRPK